MEVVFKKIPSTGMEFETSNENLKFYGKVKKESKDLVLCEGKIEGFLAHQCDRCGDEMNLEIDEDVSVYANDGIYANGDELLEVMEFFDATVNFDTILESEIGAIKSDYYYCKKCK